MKHDDGLACYALETLAEKFKAANQLPTAITFWSDGSIFYSTSYVTNILTTLLQVRRINSNLRGRFGSYGSFRIDSNLNFLCAGSFFSLAMVKGRR